MTLQEVWSLLNLYNSSFSGEQIDEAIGVILNGGISAAVDAAQASAEAAAKSASEAAGSEANVGAAATNAQNAASRASGSATEAESYAHGGTGTREGEDEDNARYYAALTEAFVAALNAAAIDGRGHLVFIAPDGSTRDLGDVTGEDGSSIQSITRTAGNGAPGTTDTYTVTLTDGRKTQFQVYNGKDGLGAGDMTAAVYDPQGKAQDVFDYASDPNNMSSPVPIAKGGTGAANAADARENLGAEKVGAAQLVFDKIISKKDQLIVNGSASLADNTGISALQFDGSQAYYSRGSFTYEHGKLAYFFSDDFFEIDPRKSYEFSFDLKSKNGVAKMYSFLTFFDADHNEIWQQNYYFRTGSTTKLAKDLVAGDTVVYLEDVSGWSKEWLLGTLLTVWNYKNSFGYQYAPEVYTRNYYPISRSGQYPTDDAIDATNNTVKLAQAYSGETIPAGTYVSQGYDGNGWGYKPCSNTIAPAEWTHFSAVLGPEYIRPGACFTKYGFFWNDRSEDDQVWGTNFVLKEKSDCVTTEEMNTAIANAIGAALEASY